MKRFFSLFIAVAILGGFSACTKDDDAISRSIDQLIGGWSLVSYEQDGQVVAIEDEDRIFEMNFATLGQGTIREKARDSYGQWYDETLAMDWNLTESRLTLHRINGVRHSVVVTELSEQDLTLDFGNGYIEYYVRR